MSYACNYCGNTENLKIIKYFPPVIELCLNCGRKSIIKEFVEKDNYNFDIIQELLETFKRKIYECPMCLSDKKPTIISYFSPEIVQCLDCGKRFYEKEFIKECQNYVLPITPFS